MSVFRRQDYPVKWIRVGDLSIVWAQAQRGLNERKVDGMVKEFDPDAFGVLVTTLPNGNGIHHVIDGQHRAEMIRRLYGLNEMVPCQVLNAKGQKKAAAIWRKINGARSKPHILDDFRVAVTAGEPAHVEVDALLRGLGYKIAFDGANGTISAIAACMAIHKAHGVGVLKDALLVIQGTWGKERDSVHNDLLRGYATMLATHGKSVDRKRLADRMAKHYTPARLIGAAKTAREMFRGTIAGNVVRVLVNTYNHGLRTELRLEETA